MDTSLEIRLESGSLDVNFEAAKDFFVSRALHKLQDLETRDGDTSRIIDVPRIPKNIRLLGSLMPTYRGIFTNNSNGLNCEILLGGMTVLTDAVLFVISESVNAATITITVAGGTVRFFNLLPETSIKFLDFSEYNLEWTLANLTALMNTDAGFLFGNSIWVDNQSIEKFLEEYDPDAIEANEIYLHHMEIDAAGGWFFLKTIVEKIFNEIRQLNIDTEFLNDGFLNNLVVQLPVSQMWDNWRKKEDTAQRGKMEQLGDIRYNGLAIHRLTFPDPVYLYPAAIWDYDENEYIITVAGLIEIDHYLQGRYIQSEEPPVYNSYGYLYKNNEIILQYEFPKEWDAPNENQTIIKHHMLKEIYCEVGDRLYCDVYLDSDSVDTFSFSHQSRGYGEPYFKIQRVGSPLGAFVEIGDYLPDISQRDFIKEILKFQHLIPVENNSSIKFIKWDEIPNQIEQDLTKYIDQSKPVVKVPFIQGYAKQNLFTYTPNDKVQRRDTGQYIPMDYGLASPETTKLTSRYVMCDPTNIDDSKRVSAPNFAITYERVDDNKITIAINDNTFSTVDPHGLEAGDHIFVYDDQSNETMKRKVIDILDDFNGIVDRDWTTGHDAFDWDYLKYTQPGIEWQLGFAQIGENAGVWDGGFFQAVANAKSVYFTDSMTWETLVNDFYDLFKDTLQTPTIIELWFVLPIIHFQQLKIEQPVYIGGANAGQYYINSIDQFKADGAVRMDLIRFTKRYDFLLAGAFDVTPVEVVILGDWEVGDPPLSQIYTMTNTGNLPVSISVLFGSAGGEQYYSFTGNTNPTIDPGDDATIQVNFNGSTVAGLTPAQILFNSQDAIPSYRTIIANVETSTYTVTPESEVNLGIWYEGHANITQPYLVTNTGTLPLLISVSAFGTGFIYSGVTPIELLPGENTTVYLVFEGVPAIGRADGGLNFVEAKGGDKTRQAFSTVEYSHSMDVSPIEIDLGDWIYGDDATDGIFTVENTGYYPIDVTANSSGSLFTIITALPVNIPVGESRPITVRFDATAQEIPGEKDSIITFTAPDVEAQPERDIFINVLAAYGYTVAPVGSVDMGEWSPGDDPLEQIYILTNTNNTVLSVSLIINGFGYQTPTESPVIVPIGGTVNATLQFVGALLANDYNGSIQFIHAQAGNQTRNATATVPEISALTVDPVEPVDLGDWQYPDAPLSQAYTLTNIGTVSLDVSFVFDNIGGYVFDRESPITVAPGTPEIVIVSTDFEINTTPHQPARIITFSAIGIIDILRNIQATILPYHEISIEPVDPAELGTWTPGDAQLSQPYTITNLGNVDELINFETVPVVRDKFAFVEVSPVNVPRLGNVIVTVQSTLNSFDEPGTIETNLTFGNIDIPDILRSVEALVLARYGYTVEPVAAVDMGEWTPGDALLEQIYTITNLYNTALSITNLIVDGLGFLTPTDTPILIAIGGVENAILNFGNVFLPATYPGSMEFVEADAGNQTRNATATALQGDLITVTPVNPVDMGTIAINTSTAQIFNLHNNTPSPVTVDVDIVDGVPGEWSGATQVIVPANSDLEYNLIFNGSGTTGERTVNVYFEPVATVEVHERNVSIEVI